MDMPGRGLVGTAMSWPLAGDFAWINMVLVMPGFRGRGIARLLMEALLGDLSRTQRVAFLDATEMGESLYRKLGFLDGPKLVRLRREPTTAIQVQPTKGFRAMSPVDLSIVAVLDGEVFGLDRQELLENFLMRRPKHAWVAESATGTIEGFVIARDGRVATQIGPLVARDRGQAAQLLHAALAGVDGPVFLDVPVADEPWLQEVTSLGFAVQRSFMRMTRGERTLPTDWSRYFAISGPDFA